MYTYARETFSYFKNKGKCIMCIVTNAKSSKEIVKIEGFFVTDRQTDFKQQFDQYITPSQCYFYALL